MKAALMVFLAFHYEAGATSSTLILDSMEQCLVAKTAIEREHQANRIAIQGDGWGRRRVFVVCAPIDRTAKP